MGIALGIVLVVVTLVVLAYPFTRTHKYVLPPDPALERLRSARLRIYRQISDLDGDLASGELSRDEYEAQVSEFRIEAARVLRDLSRLRTGSASEADLEREIAAVRVAANIGEEE